MNKRRSRSKLKVQQQTKIETNTVWLVSHFVREDRGKKREDSAYIQKHAGKQEVISPSRHIPTDFSVLMPAAKMLWADRISCEEAWSWSGPQDGYIKGGKDVKKEEGQAHDNSPAQHEWLHWLLRKLVLLGDTWVVEWKGKKELYIRR